jgi:DNA-binding response OmpR family regulator
MCRANGFTMTCRVLVVDDEPAIGFALGEYLSLRGYCVDTAASLPEAWETLARGDYEIVITDLSLGRRGGGEGLDLAALVRRQHRLTRVVILTAYGSREAEAAARLLGVEAFLHKPMPLVEIARVLHHVLQLPGTAADPASAS